MKKQSSLASLSVSFSLSLSLSVSLSLSLCLSFSLSHWGFLLISDMDFIQNRNPIADTLMFPAGCTCEKTSEIFSPHTQKIQSTSQPSWQCAIWKPEVWQYKLQLLLLWSDKQSLTPTIESTEVCKALRACRSCPNPRIPNHSSKEGIYASYIGIGKCFLTLGT